MCCELIYRKFINSIHCGDDKFPFIHLAMIRCTHTMQNALEAQLGESICAKIKNAENSSDRLKMLIVGLHTL